MGLSAMGLSAMGLSLRLVLNGGVKAEAGWKELGRGGGDVGHGPYRL